VRKIEPKSIQYNVPISFGRDGDYISLCPDGFAAPEGRYTWSTGVVSRLRFRAPPSHDDLEFELRLQPFVIAGRIPYQDFTIFLNGLWVDFRRLDRPAVLKSPLPRSYLSPEENLLSFLIPNATSPKDVGVNTDARLLGMAFYQLGINERAHSVSTSFLHRQPAVSRQPL
jgi:hypothetical protein